MSDQAVWALCIIYVVVAVGYCIIRFIYPPQPDPLIRRLGILIEEWEKLDASDEG
jgi:hypothetical protein